MINTGLCEFITDYAEWQLAGMSDALDAFNAVELAVSLERSGYCADPYLDYDKALICPINKRREKFCNCTICASHKFCEMLRKEGYV